MRHAPDLNTARARFETVFGATPEAGAVAPGRVNLIGEHTDYNGGFVMPFAIEAGALVLARRNGRARTRVHGTEPPAGEAATVELDPRAPPVPDHWSRYPIAVVRELAREHGPVPALDLLLASTVPPGAGLSSSAAIGVATATVMSRLQGVAPSPLETARLCRRAEHAAGTPCGIMDMLASAAGRAGHVLLIDCRSETLTPIRMPPGASLIVADTGVARALGRGLFAELDTTCRAAARKLGVSFLGEATIDRVEAADLSDVERRRARHVLEENARTLAAAEALRGGDLPEVGRLMHDSHVSLRDLFGVSGPELDCLVEAAMDMPGGAVHGARLTGAGFGGCVIVLGRAGAEPEIAARLAARFEAAFGRAPAVFPVRPSDGARAVP